VVVMGAGGKSGLLCLYQAKKRVGPKGRVIALEYGQQACADIATLGLADELLRVDATNPVAVLTEVERVTDGALADVTVNCVNVPGTELPAILATKDGGAVCFFSMAVRFTAAALGAEGVGKDVQMMIGNGYARGHATLTLDSLRECEGLQRLFVSRYAGSAQQV